MFSRESNPIWRLRLELIKTQINMMLKINSDDTKPDMKSYMIAPEL